MGISSVRAKALSPAVRQFIQQPAAISAIASLGIHALAFALLPILPYAALVEDKEPDIRQSVGVVELSPEEQARLPEFPSSQIDLPPLLDSLPSAVTDLPPLPVPDQSTSPPSADDLFSDPFFSSSLPNYSIPTLPQPVPLPPAPSVQPPPQSPVVIQPQTPERESSQPTGELPSLSGGSELLNPPRQQSGSERTQENGDVAANSDTATPQPSATPASPAATPSRSDEEIVADLNQGVEARRRQILVERQLTRDPVGTADDANYNPGTSWTAWTAQLQKDFGVNLENIDREAKTTIEAPFPPEVCEFVPRLDPDLLREGISADFGVVVDPDGKPIGGLSVLRSSGYALFNNKGGEAVLDHASYENKTGKNVPYLVTVVFPYSGDSCPDNAGQANASPAP